MWDVDHFWSSTCLILDLGGLTISYWISQGKVSQFTCCRSKTIHNSEGLGEHAGWGKGSSPLELKKQQPCDCDATTNSNGTYPQFRPRCCPLPTIIWRDFDCDPFGRRVYWDKHVRVRVDRLVQDVCLEAIVCCFSAYLQQATIMFREPLHTIILRLFVLGARCTVPKSASRTT